MPGDVTGIINDWHAGFINDHPGFINNNATEKGLETISAADLSERYPDVKNMALTGSSQITVCDHCKVKLALHVTSLRRLQYLELGISKGCCWLCQKFLEQLMLHIQTRFIFSQNSGKLHAGWRLPRNAPQEFKDYMESLVELEIMKVHHCALNRRRSDSFPAQDCFFDENTDKGVLDF